MTITDEMLYGAAPRAAELFLETLPGRADCGHRFSPKFQTDMRPLLSGKRRQWRRVLLAAAVAAALLAVTAGAFRETVFQMFRAESEEGGTRYAFRTMDEPGTFTPIEVPHVPEGYEQTQEYLRETETYTRYILTFEGGDGRRFYVEQQLTARLDMGFGDLSDYTLEHPDIHGAEAELYHNGEDTLLLWTEGGYVLEVSGALSREEAVEIAENITWKAERGN